MTDLISTITDTVESISTMSDKKFLFPELYPKERKEDSTALWFIRYYVEDFDTGKYKKCKFYGLLNMVADLGEREKLAANYIAMIEKGEPLPDCRGSKRRQVELGLVKPSVKEGFADCIALCHKYLQDRKHELDPRTVTQYTGRVNTFDRWLKLRGIKNRAIGAITKDICRDYLLYLKDTTKLANGTYNDYKTMFGSMWQEYVNEGKISGNPWRRIKTLPAKKKHLESYTPALRKLIREKLPAYDRQLWLFLQTVYYCAIRPHCELRLLKRKDLHFERGMFVIPEELSYSDASRAVNIFGGLLQQYQAAGYQYADTEHYLFTTSGKPGEKPVSINYFGTRWNAFKKAYDIPTIYKLYGSKHTGGKALTLDFNSYVTKEHMRHRSLDSTEQYIDELDKNDLKFLQESFPVF